MTGLVALHGGAEYVAGDEPAMDALLAAAVEAAAGEMPRIVLLPTAVARHRPELAVAHGERAFRAAAARAGVDVRVDVAWVLAPGDASDPDAGRLLEMAHLVHLPGGDPDLIPTVLRGTLAWGAVLAAWRRGACLAGASAGAMALCDRLWTSDGPIDGLGVVPGFAVLPHFGPRRLAAWRSVVDEVGRPLAWLGLDERTMVIGRPGEDPWRVVGAGRAHLLPPGAAVPSAGAGNGEILRLG